MLLIGSTAQARSLIPEVTVLTCKSKQQFADYGYTVELRKLPTYPQGMSYLVAVSTMTIAGTRTEKEFAVERVVPRPGAPMYYVSNSYSFAVNYVTGQYPLPAELRGRNGLQVALECYRAR
jgi:hypothetical protein